MPSRSIVTVLVTLSHVMREVWVCIKHSEVTLDYMPMGENGNYVKELHVMRVVERRVQEQTLCDKSGCSTTKFGVFSCNEDGRRSNGM